MSQAGRMRLQVDERRGGHASVADFDTTAARISVPPYSGPILSDNVLDPRPDRSRLRAEPKRLEELFFHRSYAHPNGEAELLSMQSE